MSTIVYLLSCFIVGYCGFCRLVHTDLTTKWCIRAIFWLLTVAAITNATAILFWAYAPGWPAAMLAVAIAAVQMATVLLWQEGVPKAFQLSEVPPEG